eukprot:TRINITY_DN7973_c0_g1_i5.p1 TRINITY_DN7973_c0_g1~~TRINITY_DN7973_c0_g1_i5.p1  ORF type:complete len:235 (+),score=83.87 TRINITY_DN7973_c0_g1_i5:209-913(+)
MKMQKPTKTDMIGKEVFTQRKAKLQEELKIQKAKLKEKRELLQKKEKHMIEQHEKYIALEERCRRMQTLIAEYKAGIKPPVVETHKTEEDVKSIQGQLAELLRKYEQEKQEHSLSVKKHQELIKDLKNKLCKANAELQSKVEETRSNYIKINELKKYVRIVPNGNVINTAIEARSVASQPDRIVNNQPIEDVARENIEEAKEEVIVEDRVEAKKEAKVERAEEVIPEKKEPVRY